MRNQALIVFDSLRWDTFRDANLPTIKSFPFEKAFTHGTYTLPAHTSFFIGKLPHTRSGSFDTCARSGRKTDGRQWWRLNNPESPGDAHVQLDGRNIVHGFNMKGYDTVGTGAVGWFNINKPAHISAIDDFKKFGFFGEFTVAKKQIDYVLEELPTDKKFFLFMNFGETHHSYRIRENDEPINWGDKRCRSAQIRCIEYLDKMIERLLQSPKMKNTDIILCSDHGDCMGEDGLWGHSFFHEKVIEVPIVEAHI
jgi:hypothetical protein